jgi:hypothetical protein
MDVLMRALIAIALAGCSHILEGPYTAEVTTTLDGMTTQTIEEIEIVERSLGDNERGLRRTFDEPCELPMFKRGGYGLRIVAGTSCARDGETWTIVSGAVPDEDTETIVMELAWDVGGRAATETLRFER